MQSSAASCQIYSCLNISGTCWQHTCSFEEIDALGVGILHPIMNLTGSPLSCMIYCSKIQDCLLFSFDGDEIGMCLLSSSVLLSYTSTSTGMKIYDNLCSNQLLAVDFSTLLAQGQLNDTLCHDSHNHSVLRPGYTLAENLQIA